MLSCALVGSCQLDTDRKGGSSVEELHPLDLPMGMPVEAVPLLIINVGGPSPLGNSMVNQTPLTCKPLGSLS